MFNLFILYLKNNLKDQEDIIKREWEGTVDLIKKKKKYLPYSNLLVCLEVLRDF